MIESANPVASGSGSSYSVMDRPENKGLFLAAYAKIFGKEQNPKKTFWLKNALGDIVGRSGGRDALIKWLQDPSKPKTPEGLGVLYKQITGKELAGPSE